MIEYPYSERSTRLSKWIPINFQHIMENEENKVEDVEKDDELSEAVEATEVNVGSEEKSDETIA